MAGDTTPAAVAALYPGLLDALVVDAGDAHRAAGVPLVAAATLMSDREAARRLARVVLEVNP